MFLTFPGRKIEFQNDDLSLPEKIYYRKACHTLFLGLVVDHWAKHYLFLQFSDVCVCVFHNKKAKKY